MLFGAWLIAIWILHVIYSQEGGLISVLSSSSGHSSRGGGIDIVMIIFGPLFNLYVWYKWSDFFSEAEDDIFINHKSPPSKKHRKIVIRIFSMVIGAIFFPLFIWFYTSNLQVLWPDDKTLFGSPGFILSVIVSVLGAYIIPNWFPRFTKHLRRIDEGIDNIIEQKSEKM